MAQECKPSNQNTQMSYGRLFLTKLRGYGFFFARSSHTHSHTIKETLTHSLSHSYTEMGAEAFSSSSSSLSHLYIKESNLQHIYESPSVCTENKNIGRLSMYASCVKLPTTVVGIIGSPGNPPRIPSITLASVGEVVGGASWCR